jgi:glycosidase
LIELRRQYHALSVGAVRVLAVENDVLFFERSCEGERIIVALNFGDEGAPINVPEVQGATALLSTFMDWTGKSTKARLRPSEGIMFRAA